MLAVIETHPVQYHAPVYRALQQRWTVPVTAIYGSDFSVAGCRDEEFGIDVAWDTDLIGGYSSIFLSQVACGGARNTAEVSWKGIGRAVRQIAPEAALLVGYSPPFHQAAFLAARCARVPILFRAETTDHARQRSGVMRGLRDVGLHAFYRGCSRLLYVGQRSLEHFCRLGVPADRLVFSPYCVDTTPFRPDEAARNTCRTRTRRELGLADDDVALLFSGKLSPRKAPDVLLHAVRLLASHEQRRTVVLFLGHGEMSTMLKGIAARPPALRVHFLGFRNQRELSPYHHAADLLVLPSLHGETWGLVVNEALHHGAPCVVSSAVGCAPDLVEPGATGEICQPGVPESLADALQRAVTLTGRAEIRDACRRKVATYSLDAAASGIARAYRAVAGRTREVVRA